jgi:tripartite-type tricarboxylate transporter receptor subunit TctC
VTLLNGYPAGGNVDIVSRQLIEGMKARFPKGLVIVYRPGAAGAVAVTELVRSFAASPTATPLSLPRIPRS